jgi:hypothetical protein
MASDLSKYLGNKLVRWLAGQAMPAAPAQLYVAFFDGDPKASGTEVTTTLHAAGRVGVTWTIPASNDTDNILVNSAGVSFSTADADTPMSHVAIFDAQVGGKRLGSKGLVGGATTITAGTPVSFEAGDLSFTLGS